MRRFLFLALLVCVIETASAGCKKWTVHLQTSKRSISKDAGTDAAVEIRLVDENDQKSGWRSLWTEDYDDFQAGYHQNFYIVTTPLGRLKRIDLRVTGDWYTFPDDFHLRYIEVYDEARQLQYYKYVNGWLEYGNAYHWDDFTTGDAQKWKVYVKTTDASFKHMDPGTESDVYIRLYGDKTGARYENELSTPRLNDFKANFVNGYNIWTRDLGPLKEISLQVRRYVADHWHPEWIMLYDTRRGINYKKNLNTWLMHGTTYWYSDFENTGNRDQGYDIVSQYYGYKKYYGVDEDRCT